MRRPTRVIDLMRLVFYSDKDKDKTLTVHLRVVLDCLLDLVEAGLLPLVRRRRRSRAKDAVPPHMINQNLDIVV